MSLARIFSRAVMLIALLGSTITFAEDAKAPDELLWKACSSGRGEDSVEDVKNALSLGADINMKDERSGQTCFMAVTLRGKPNILRYIIEKGADHTIPERSGYTPPHGAGFQGRVDIMKILKEEAKIDVVNSSHDDGFAPLHRACWGNEERHAETVEYLLSIGEDPDRKGTGDKKETCLEMTKNPHTIAVLEKYGVKKPTTDDEL